jgi:hypothetical protein
MGKYSKKKIDKQKKYTFDEMVATARDLAKDRFDKLVVQCINLAMQFVIFTLQDTFKFTDEDIAIFHRDFERYCDDYVADKFTAMESETAYKSVYKACKKYEEVRR